MTVYGEFFGEPNSSSHGVGDLQDLNPPVDKEVCLDSQFHLEAFQFMKILSFM